MVWTCVSLMVSDGWGNTFFSLCSASRLPSRVPGRERPLGSGDSASVLLSERLCQCVWLSAYAVNGQGAPTGFQDVFVRGTNAAVAIP